MVLLNKIISMILKFRGGLYQEHQRSSNKNFQKVYFCAAMHRKSILDITGSQIQAEASNGHQALCICCFEELD